MSVAHLVCIIGAESTGKTTLARALAAEFESPWVAEYLRDFCAAHQRTPAPYEQQRILETQVAWESAALRRAQQRQAPWVFCDTAPLLTAVYSDFIFADLSLHQRARELHSRYTMTLLLQPDLAWVADGLQRDGQHVQGPVTKKLKRELDGLKLPYISIAGQGNERIAAAIKAVNGLKTQSGFLGNGSRDTTL
jgi:nicotinamide riboside kinase